MKFSERVQDAVIVASICVAVGGVLTYAYLDRPRIKNTEVRCGIKMDEDENGNRTYKKDNSHWIYVDKSDTGMRTLDYVTTDEVPVSVEDLPYIEGVLNNYGPIAANLITQASLKAYQQGDRSKKVLRVNEFDSMLNAFDGCKEQK